MPTRHGTANFESLLAAQNSYGKHNALIALEEGRIEIGKPTVKKGEKLLIDQNRRYHIETKD